ncbi:MAG: RNA 2',3'-cyclic phosphodiesterase [Sphingomonas sp.]|nr:RNA 2',3'-cyclic phosphodiesterase [Sphingomonas sp.]
MHRLFIGLRPPREIRAALMSIMGGIAGARWQSDDQLHLTLRYIGEVDRQIGEEVALAMARIRAQPLAVALCGVGRFEKQGRTDAIWAGVAPGDALQRLHHKIDHALVAIGLPAEARAYLPHITLARLPRSLGVEQEIDGFIAAHAAFSSAPFAFTHITLFESQLTRDGARYDVVDRWPIIG